METGEGFMSVMDHGVEVSIEHLPKLPCSKFTILGNSRMRNKRPVRKKEQMWKVPKGSRRHQNEREKPSADLKQSLKVKSKSLEPRFGNQEELNRFDKNGIYGDAFHRTLDMTQPSRSYVPTPRHSDPESKVEKNFINDFYRDRSSLFLPQCGNRAGKRSRNSGHHVSLPSLSKGAVSNGSNQRVVSQTCQGNARHYCDVVGQRYCTACLRTHRLSKLAHRTSEASEDRYHHPKATLVTSLPKIRRATSFFDKEAGCVDTTSSTHGVSRTKSSPLLTHEKHSSYVPRSWEKMGDLARNLKDNEDRKRRKLTQKSSVVATNTIPRVSDITTDNDSRHI